MFINYYAPTAYNSKQIPKLPAQTHKAGSLPVYVRIPWGENKQETVEYQLFKEYSPNYLRRFKDTKYAYSWVGDERFGAITHQFIRADSISWKSKFWGGLYIGGIAIIILSVFLITLEILLYFFEHLSLLNPLKDKYTVFIIQYALLPSLLSTFIGYIVLYYIPFLSRRPSIGSKWELNRQTGMVTNYTYLKGKSGEPVISDSVPFYECDAYLWSAPNRYGLTHSLVLGHRYSDKVFLIGDFIGRVTIPYPVYAYWDMLQTYMDTSKPLPDIPVLEQFRALDPVTAEYDRKSGRNPQYFLNMDKTTWNSIKSEVAAKRITIEERHCLMQQHGVDYFPECKWA